MSWAAINTFCTWAHKRRGLLCGVVNVAVEEMASCFPGGRIAVKLLGEVAKHGLRRLQDPAADVPDVKPAGKTVSEAEWAELNDWLNRLTTVYGGLLDQLDRLTAANDDQAQVNEAVRKALAERQELAKLFTEHRREVRRQTLRLRCVEEQLDVLLHVTQQVPIHLEGFKAYLLELPGFVEFMALPGDERTAVLKAYRHFEAGQRDEGVAALLDVVKKRGAGATTVCRVLGVRYVSEGKLKEAYRQLRDPSVPSGAALTRLRNHVAQTMLRGTTLAEAKLPVWRTLPRGFEVGGKYRVEEEVGRGGMASVYRAVCVDDVDEGLVVALKVPAAGLMADPATRKRFVEEIQISRKLSAVGRADLVQTIGYERLSDPHTGQTLYALVLEFVEGKSLAEVLAARAEQGEMLPIEQVYHLMKPVCTALEYAHGRNPPVLHRDAKPQNVMVTAKGEAKLMDFGIARLLEDTLETVEGLPPRTDVYAPPEFYLPEIQNSIDARSDVYLAGNLLREMVTLNPHGVLDGRKDCPPEWRRLITESMSPDRDARPQTVRAFLDRLGEGVQEALELAKLSDAERAAREWMRKLPQRLTNSIGMQLALIPAGRFLMGSPDGEGNDSEHPQHEVEISKAFYVGVFPVTQAQYQKVTSKTPSNFGNNPEHPVEQVAWSDAVDFCRKLSELPAEKALGRVYCLPSEAEWEYACRAGTTTRYHCGDELTARDANFARSVNSTSKVGSFPANAWGLHDMHGNVWEWCEDVYDANYYKNSPKKDPKGGQSGQHRVLRGGSWNNDADYCRAAYRYGNDPGTRFNYGGFRVVLIVPPRTP